VQQGDSVELGVFGKYVDPKKIRLSPASFVRTGMDKKLIQQLTEYGQNLSTVGVNEIAIANVIALVITELQQKPVPEAYMGYALYDSDSTLYEQGKVILSKKARNKHEELIKKIAVPKDGYIETYLVNETSDDVWFDQFRILSTGPLIVQETHYDPWGVELSGLGYQYGGIKVNPYLYNGKEANGHLGVNLYDYGARMYDPAIGRWFVVDPMAELAPDWTPYRYGFNNPLKYTDPTGMFEYSDGYSTQDSRNSTGSMSFSGTYEYRTINTDLITVQAGENAPVSGGYIESYVKETGSVTGRSYFGSSPNLFGAGGFGDMNSTGENLYKASSVASYLLGTAHTALEIYADQKIAQNELQTLRRAKALGSASYGATTAIKNSNKYLTGLKIIGKGLSKPFFFAGLGMSAIDVANGGSLGWAIADTGVGILGLGATAIGVALGAPVIGTAIAIGSVGYFTFRIGSEIYNEFGQSSKGTK